MYEVIKIIALQKLIYIFHSIPFAIPMVHVVRTWQVVFTGLLEE